MDYGQRLRHFRLLRNMTQQDLAMQAGIPSTSMSRIETNDRKMTLDEAVRVAKILGVSLDDLTKEGEEGPGETSAMGMPWDRLQDLVSRYSPETWEAASQVALLLKSLAASQPSHSRWELDDWSCPAPFDSARVLVGGLRLPVLSLPCSLPHTSALLACA